MKPIKSEEKIAMIEEAICNHLSSFLYQPFLKNTIDQINQDCAKLIRGFLDEGYIEIDEKGSTIYVNKEVDGLEWLCLLPLVFTIMTYGTYTVKVNRKVVGQVTYNGMGESCIEDGNLMVGANTVYTPAEPLEKIYITGKLEV